MYVSHDPTPGCITYRNFHVYAVYQSGFISEEQNFFYQVKQEGIY